MYKIKIRPGIFYNLSSLENKEEMGVVARTNRSAKFSDFCQCFLTELFDFSVLQVPFLNDREISQLYEADLAFTICPSMGGFLNVIYVFSCF